MQHFQPSEFRRFDQMDPEFLSYLDEVREVAGVPFHITSDGRTSRENAAIPGNAGDASLHVYTDARKASAVDFVTPGILALDAQAYYVEAWKIARACAFVVRQRAHQLEIVKGSKDWHLHLGLYAAGDPHESRLVVSVE